MSSLSTSCSSLVSILLTMVSDTLLSHCPHCHDQVPPSLSTLGVLQLLQPGHTMLEKWVPNSELSWHLQTTKLRLCFKYVLLPPWAVTVEEPGLLQLLLSLRQSHEDSWKIGYCHFYSLVNINKTEDLHSEVILHNTTGVGYTRMVSKVEIFKQDKMTI